MPLCKTLYPLITVALIQPREIHPYMTDTNANWSLPLNHSRRVGVSYKRKYVHEVLANCLLKFAQEKCVVR